MLKAFENKLASNQPEQYELCLIFTQNQGQHDRHAILQAEERCRLASTFGKWQSRCEKVCIVVLTEETVSVRVGVSQFTSNRIIDTIIYYQSR